MVADCSHIEKSLVEQTGTADGKMVTDLRYLYQSLVKQVGLKTRYPDFANQQIRKYRFNMGEDIFAFRGADRKKVFFVEKSAYNKVRTAYQNQYNISLPAFSADYYLTRTEDKKASVATEDKKGKKLPKIEDLEAVDMNSISYICELANLDEEIMLDAFCSVWSDLMARPVDNKEIDILCGIAVYDKDTKSFDIESLLGYDVEDFSDDELAFRLCISKDMLLHMLYYYDKQDKLTPLDISDILDAWNSTL